MTNINEVLKDDKFEGFKCDDNLGPFLSGLRQWHQAYQPEVVDDDVDKAFDATFGPGPVPWWRLTWISAWSP